jgi:hypothetical protein
MAERLKNCWELRKCGRERGGPNVTEMGECPVSREGFGHSCWALAGTLCGGKVTGTFARKEGCMLCEVYKAYHRIVGTEGKRVIAEFPDEQQRYNAMLMRRMKGGGHSGKSAA